MQLIYLARLVDKEYPRLSHISNKKKRNRNRFIRLGVTMPQADKQIQTYTYIWAPRTLHRGKIYKDPSVFVEG